LNDRVRWFVRGDIDGFFGLFIDNLLQLMLMVVLSGAVCGLPSSLVVGRILPGAGVSILLGNLFYAWQAHKTGRAEATALPFGINTPSLLAFMFLVMGPVYQETKDPTLTWRVGLFACLLSGIFEGLGAFVGDWLRRHTPRAALLSALAGVAITFISMGFVFQIFARPWIALFPMLLLLTTYASRVRLPLGVPGGLAAVLLGTVLAWILRAFDPSLFEPSHALVALGFHPPVPVISDALALIADARAYRYMSVIFPMGLFNVIGSLQNLESAEAAGDRYETMPALLANGLGTVAAAFLGSPFPTTIYIGHPAWKAMGARNGYSILNGTVVALLCFSGSIPLVLRVIPIEATLGILLWVGIIITAQAFQETPREHALAVALGLLPSLAAWTLVQIETALRAAGTTLFDAAPKFGAELSVRGLIALSQGFLLTSMVLSAMLVFILEKRFLRAAGWAMAAAVLSMVGLIHAYNLTPRGIENRLGFMVAPGFAVMYAAGALLLTMLHRSSSARSTASGSKPSSAPTSLPASLAMRARAAPTIGAIAASGATRSVNANSPRNA
jgi:AGZA family xanthine/uracil permease-like MFS transporter